MGVMVMVGDLLIVMGGSFGPECGYGIIIIMNII
jgi:hypothetical protein